MKSKGEWNSLILFLMERLFEEALLYSRGRIATFLKKLAHLCGSTEIIRVVTAELPKSRKLRIRNAFLNMYWM